MKARIHAVLGPDIRYHLTVVHFWLIAIAVFWMHTS